MVVGIWQFNGVFVVVDEDIFGYVLCVGCFIFVCYNVGWIEVGVVVGIFDVNGQVVVEMYVV